jgi:hypothetical protein
MKYIVKDFPANITPDKLEGELNKLDKDGIKIISCEYVRHDYFDLQRQPIFKTYIRVIGERQIMLGKSSEPQLLKG